MGTQKLLIGKKCCLLDFLLVFLVAQLKIFLTSAAFPADLWGLTETAASAAPGTRGKAVLNYLAYRKTI